MFICMKSRQSVKLGCLEKKLMYSLEVMKLYEVTVLIQSFMKLLVELFFPETLSESLSYLNLDKLLNLVI